MSRRHTAESFNNHPSQQAYPCSELNEHGIIADDLLKEAVYITKIENSKKPTMNISDENGAGKIEDSSSNICPHYDILNDLSRFGRTKNINNLDNIIVQNKNSYCTMCSKEIGCAHFAIICYIIRQSGTIGVNLSTITLPSMYKDILLESDGQSFLCTYCNTIINSTQDTNTDTMYFNGIISYMTNSGINIDEKNLIQHIQPILLLIRMKIFDHKVNIIPATVNIINMVLRQWPLYYSYNKISFHSVIMHLITHIIALIAWCHSTTVINQIYPLLSMKTQNLPDTIKQIRESLSQNQLLEKQISDLSDFDTQIMDIINKKIKPFASEFEKYMVKFINQMQCDELKQMTIHTKVKDTFDKPAKMSVISKNLKFSFVPYKLHTHETEEEINKMPMIDQDGHVHIFYNDICTECQANIKQASKSAITTEEYLHTRECIEIRQNVCPKGYYHTFVNNTCTKCDYNFNTTFAETFSDIKENKISMNIELKHLFKPMDISDTMITLQPYKESVVKNIPTGILDYYISNMLKVPYFDKSQNMPYEILNITLKLTSCLFRIISPFKYDNIQYIAEYNKCIKWFKDLEQNIDDLDKLALEVVQEWALVAFEDVCRIIGSLQLNPPLSNQIKVMLLNTCEYSSIYRAAKYIKSSYASSYDLVHTDIDHDESGSVSETINVINEPIEQSKNDLDIPTEADDAGDYEDVE